MNFLLTLYKNLNSIVEAEFVFWVLFIDCFIIGLLLFPAEGQARLDLDGVGGVFTIIAMFCFVGVTIDTLKAEAKKRR